MTERLPSYDELPAVPGRPAGSSWGLWGDDDVLGCLNLLTPERVRRAAGLVRKGAVFALNLEAELPDPPLFGRPAFRHDVSWLPNEVGHDDELSGWNTQSSSQWDGFRHIRHQVHGFYNGVADEAHGVHHWARRGIVGRGVLVDVGRFRAKHGRPLAMDQPDPIEPADLEQALDEQGVTVEPGDILLVRTGWVGWYRSLDAEGRRRTAENLAAPGLRPGKATAAALWDLHVAAVAADNPALELWPPGALATEDVLAAMASDPEAAVEVFVHFSLLPLLGLPIGEMWDLEALAEDCAADGVYEFLLASAPLNLHAGVASPPNALAVK
jgi:kynurenine formamidase